MFKLNKKVKQAGMTYVELIVVLSIFSVLSSVAIFNYGDFQARVDIKNLASDIALKIVEAQKSSLSGQLPPLLQQSQISSTWKPSYGLYLDRVADNKSFTYFTDLNPQNSLYNSSSCPGAGECLDKITITKGNYIDRIDRCSNIACSPATAMNNPLSITFKRPDSKAVFYSNGILALTGSEYVQITIKSPRLNTAKIKIYPSGRIQVN